METHIICHALQVESINLYFGNEVFSLDSKQCLETVSKINRETKDDWYPDNTICLSIRNNFSKYLVDQLTSEKYRKGIYNLSFEINVHNSWNIDSTPSILVQCIY